MALEAGLYFSQGFRLSPAAYLVLTLMQVMVAGGTIFGWQALLPVLYEEGVFAASCEGGKLDPEYPCQAQRSKLTLVFSVAVRLYPQPPLLHFPDASALGNIYCFSRAHFRSMRTCWAPP
jgi:hypothetical protein